MNEKFELVHFDGDEELTPKLYRRLYSTTAGKPRVRYYAIFTDWKKVRRKFPLGGNEKAAIRRLAEYQRKNDAEYDWDEGKARSLTLSAWAEQCGSAMKPRDHSLLPHLERFFGKMTLSKIDDKAIIDYRARRKEQGVIRGGKERKRRISATCANKELACLRKLLRLALPKGYLRMLPRFTMEKEISRERTLSAEEYGDLLENSPVWLRRVIVAARETALSRSDLLGLTREQINRYRNNGGEPVRVIEIRRNKTTVKQQIPILSADLIQVINEVESEFKRMPNTAGLLFNKGGQRIYPMCLRRALQRACKQANIANFTFHDLRHCAISNWHTMGIPVSVAMRMAGHSSVQSHKKYVNLGTQEVINVVEKLFTSCSQEKNETSKNSVSA